MSDKKDKPKLKRGRPPKHGTYLYLAKGEIPENKRHLVPILTGLRNGLIEEYGPREPDLTTTQLLYIDRSISLLTVLRLIEEYVVDNGFFDGNTLIPVLRESYIAYNNSLRLTLRELAACSGEREPESDIVELGRKVCSQNQKGSNK